MSNCEQTKGMSVMEHGISVHNYFKDLVNHFKQDRELKYQWRLPDWLNESFLWENIYLDKGVENYHIYHDCGKPFCLEVDDGGKRHFPNHAKVSGDIWFGLTGNKKEADLMLHDMDMHLLKSDQVEEFSKNENALILLVTALCEIHSNAEMFGGIESTSFKIKWKKINKFGKRILKNKKEESENGK